MSTGTVIFHLQSAFFQQLSQLLRWRTSGKDRKRPFFCTASIFCNYTRPRLFVQRISKKQLVLERALIFWASSKFKHQFSEQERVSTEQIDPRSNTILERATIFWASSEFEHQFSERAHASIEQLDVRSNTKSSHRVNFGKEGIRIFSHYKFIKTILIMD